MEHIGIDVHKVERQLCSLTENGEIIESRIRTQRERFGVHIAPGVHLRDRLAPCVPW